MKVSHIRRLMLVAMSSRVEYRALEGFVFAVSPFNFTAIGGNLSAGKGTPIASYMRSD